MEILDRPCSLENNIMRTVRKRTLISCSLLQQQRTRISATTDASQHESITRPSHSSHLLESIFRHNWKYKFYWCKHLAAHAQLVQHPGCARGGPLAAGRRARARRLSRISLDASDTDHTVKRQLVITHSAVRPFHFYLAEQRELQVQ